MNLLGYVIVNIGETLLRMLPLPARTGIIKVGHPGKEAPVLLTGNYHLTIARVKRALIGMDAYLLVANSQGINIWCASAGGHFTNHRVISALKTSGIEKLVDHRNVILPQLAATGVETEVIANQTGWKIIWGPVYARDIPQFLRDGLKKTPQMREVYFPWTARLEMAISWAFPISLVAILIVLPFWRQSIPYLTTLVWGMALLMFAAFPLYSRWLTAKGRRIGFIFFDFGRGGFQLILWGFVLIGLTIYSLASDHFTGGFLLRWGLTSLAVITILSIDLRGSTPVYHSGLSEDRLLQVYLDKTKCRGAGFCEQVCPRDCYRVNKGKRTTTMPRAEQCLQCGACIVQCPYDALYFKNPKGEVIPPESIRRFKMNLLGKRLVKPEGV